MIAQFIFRKKFGVWPVSPLAMRKVDSVMKDKIRYYHFLLEKQNVLLNTLTAVSSCKQLQALHNIIEGLHRKSLKVKGEIQGLRRLTRKCRVNWTYSG